MSNFLDGHKFKVTKDRLNSNTTIIGSKFILILKNKDFAPEYGKMLKSLGVNCFGVKYFYDHSHKEFSVVEQIPDSFIKNLVKEVQKLCDGKFNSLVRAFEFYIRTIL